MSCSKPVAVRIVDIQTSRKGFPLAVGDVSSALNPEKRQLVFYDSQGSEGGSEAVHLAIETVFVMNSKTGWTLDLNWRGWGVPTSILLAMSLWALPLDRLAGEMSPWGIKAILWVAVSIPLLLRRGRQQLALELVDDGGVLIVETLDPTATVELLNI